jgi:hypothetical protein
MLSHQDFPAQSKNIKINISPCVTFADKGREGYNCNENFPRGIGVGGVGWGVNSEFRAKFHIK